MRTIDDVEEAFRALADTAPEPAPLPLAEAPSTGRGRRAWLAPVAAAAATVLVAGAIVYATSRSGDDGPPSGGPAANRDVPALTGPAADAAPDLTFRFTATAPDGGAIPSYGIDRDGQVLDFWPAARATECRRTSAPGSACAPVAEVRLHYANPVRDKDERPFDPARVTHRVATRVNGHPAFYGRVDNALDPSEKLYWQYAPGAIAEAGAPSRAAELALAESVRAASTPVRIPVAPTVSGGQYANLVTSEPAGTTGHFELTNADVRQGGYDLGWGHDIYDVSDAPGRGPDPQDVTVDGRTWTITGGQQLLATLKDSPIPLDVLPYLGSTRTALVEMLRGLRLAPDLADPTTWFSAADVLR